MKWIRKFFDWLKKHEHCFGEQQWFRAPTSSGHVTGFLILFCRGLTCNCAVVMPKDNLMKYATPESRNKLLESLNEQGWRLVEK